MKQRLISCIVPCYNELESVPEFYRRMAVVADDLSACEFEFLFINDGSTDGTAHVLNELAATEDRVKVLHLARNHGHQTAITAGMDFAAGDIIVILDADLQDPPELLREMVAKVEEGYDIIHMQRRSRIGETWFKLLTARIFYAVMARFTDGAVISESGDFRAFTRQVLAVARRFREEHRFMRGIFAMMGFRQYTLRYDRDERYAGITKYPFRKMLRLSTNAVLSFSSSPVKLIAWLSFLLWSISLIFLIKVLVDHFILKVTVQGWTSIIILMIFFTGIIIFCLSIVASYVGRIFEQGQRRPLYWLSDARNVDLETADQRIPEVQLSRDILQR